MVAEQKTFDSLRGIMHRNASATLEDLKRQIRVDLKHGLLTKEISDAFDHMVQNVKKAVRTNIGGKLVVALEDYPGLVTLLQDKHLRKKLVVHDTGAGIVILHTNAHKWLPMTHASAAAQELSEARAALDLFRRTMLDQEYPYSLRHMFAKHAHQLNEEISQLVETKFGEIESRLKIGKVDDFVRMAISLSDYAPYKAEFWRDMAELTVYAVEILSIGMKHLEDRVSIEQRKELRRTLLVTESTINALKAIGCKHSPQEAHRYDYALIYVKELVLEPH